MSDINSNTYQDRLIGEHEHEALQASLLSQVASVIGSIAAFTAFNMEDDGPQSSYRGRVPGSKNKKRKRKDMAEYLGSMDEKLFQRRYRMSKDAFYMLLDIIGDHLPSTGEDRKRGSTPNGNVTREARLSIALRYCAGGDPLDIASMHGMPDNYVSKNLRGVVDAIHSSPELDINFPKTHEEQMQVMEGF